MRARRSDEEAARALARRSPFAVRFFARVFRQALARDFHAMRVSRAGPPPPPGAARLVLYCNHPSWWDGVAFLLLAARMFPGRPGYAPIEARMLGRYGFMARIGCFGIETQSRAGADAFLATARKVLERPEGLLLVTAQGRFADVRERPLVLRPGLAHLARRHPDVSFVPLALDYVFWDERKPEMLVRFGPPVAAASLGGLGAADATAALASALEATMDALAAEAIARDPVAFEALFGGSVGVGGVYDLWRRGRAMLRGERFSPAHGEER